MAKTWDEKLSNLSVNLADLSAKAADASEDAKAYRELREEAIKDKIATVKGNVAAAQENARLGKPEVQWAVGQRGQFPVGLDSLRRVRRLYAQDDVPEALLLQRPEVRHRARDERFAALEAAAVHAYADWDSPFGSRARDNADVLP